MKQILKTLLVIFLGFIFWILLIFGAFSFLKLNMNPIYWGENLRIAFLMISGCCLIFIPFIIFELNDK